LPKEAEGVRLSAFMIPCFDRIGNSAAIPAVDHPEMEFLRAKKGPIIIGLIVLGAWFALRTSATSLDSIEDLDARLARGEPVVLEFFANT